MRANEAMIQILHFHSYAIIKDTNTHVRQSEAACAINMIL
jgi:hypothetical protein